MHNGGACIQHKRKPMSIFLFVTALLFPATQINGFLPPSVPSRIQSHRRVVEMLDFDLPSTSNGRVSSDLSLYNSTEMLNEALKTLSWDQHVDDAMKLLSAAELSSEVKPDPSSYIVIMKALVEGEDKPERVEMLLERMRDHCHVPAAAVNLVISSWANVASDRSDEAPQRADELLDGLWNVYLQTKNYTVMPSRATYMAAMSAHAFSGKGVVAAKRVEELLEEMDYYADMHPSLSPLTVFVNVAM